MANLKTDSPLSRRIVLSFLDFLNSVEPAPGVDPEGLEVAKECLVDVFNIDLSNNQTKPESLVELFSSREPTEQNETKSDPIHDRFSAETPNTSSASYKADAHTQGNSKDELCGQFFDALEKVLYFKTLPDGNDDQEMEKSGCQTYDRKSLAEILKSQGNKAMQLKLYSDAVELYTFAIALFDDNAVFYCNRAAAYTQINQYTEAIRDCCKSIEIDPNYSKAYSRLGFAYYAQGYYGDALEGFRRALQLDPTNDSIKENIRVADEKLKEQISRAGHNQNSSSSSHQGFSNQQSTGGSRSQAMHVQFTSMPFAGTGIPPEIASMFRNVTGADLHQGSHSEDEPEGNSHRDDDPFSEAEIQIGENFSVNLGGQMPEELSGAFRSVLEMFSGEAGPHGNNSSQDNSSGRSAPS